MSLYSPYITAVINNLSTTRRTKTVYTLENGFAALDGEKSIKYNYLKEAIQAQENIRNECKKPTLKPNDKVSCANQIAALQNEIITLRAELDSINKLLPPAYQFTEHERGFVYPQMYGGRKYIINSIKNSKTKHKSHRKNRLSKSHSRRRRNKQA
jgi:hypothetical protein